MAQGNAGVPDPTGVSRLQRPASQSISSSGPPRRKLSRVRYYLPLFTSAILVALFAVYYYFYVAGQTRYFDQRAFRLLSVMGDKVASEADGIHGALAASTALASAPEARDYLFANLHLIGVRTESVSVVQNYSDQKQHRDGAFFLQLLPPASGFELMAKYQEPPGDSPVPPACPMQGGHPLPAVGFLACARIQLQDQLHNILDGLNEQLFDDLAITDASGRVLYQQSTAGERIADFNYLIESVGSGMQAGTPSPPTEAPRPAESPGGSAKPAAFAQASAYANLVTVKLGGQSYLLYLQPLTVRIYQEDGTAAPLVLCGLRNARRAHALALAIPYTYVIWASLALLAVLFLGWPVLRIFFSSPKERLRLVHVLSLILSTLLATVLLTLIALNLSYMQHDEEEARTQLVELSESIRNNLQTELRRVLELLEATSTPEYLQTFQANSGEKFWTLTNALAECQKNGSRRPPERACQALDRYPYFHYLFWVDDEGIQQFKATIDRWPTTQTSVAEQGYFTNVVAGTNLSQLLSSGKPLPHGQFFLQPTFSPNTGEFLAVVAVPYSGGGVLDAAKKDLHLKVAVLAARLESLYDTVLPEGFGYAVVDESGKVQFHSTVIRNLIEDFFLETRDSPALLSMVREGSEGTFIANYLGKRQLLHVSPMKDFQHPRWFLVTFRDWEDYTAVNLSVIMVFTLMVAAYVLILTLIAGIYIAQEREYPLEAIWPCDGSSPDFPPGKQLPNYFHIVLTNAFLTSCYLLVYNHIPIPSLLLLATLVVSFMGVLYPFVRGGAPGRWVTFYWKVPTFILCLEFRPSGWAAWLLLVPVAFLVVSIPGIARAVEPRFKKLMPLRYQYTAVVVSLLIVLIVAPCCGLFKVAYESVHRLSLERQQLALVRNLEARRQRVDSYYQKRDALGIAGKRVALLLDRYDLAFPDADLDFPPDPPRIPFRPGILEWLISRSGILFSGNSFAADLRGLARGEESLYEWWLQGGVRRRDRSQVFALRIKPVKERDSPVPEIASALPTWQGLDSWGSLALLGVVLLLFLWIFFVTIRVFLMKLENVPPLDLWKPASPIESNLIVIGHPKSGKRKAVKALAQAEHVDLAQRAASGDWNLNLPVAPAVILEHFEFGIDDPKTNMKKLQFLEELLYVHRVWVVILSTVDPMFYLVSEGAQILGEGADDLPSITRLLDRWAGVLSKFRKVRIEDTSVAEFLGMLSGRRQAAYAAHFSDLYNWVQKECDHTAFLRSVVAERILEAHRVPEGMSVEELAGSLLDARAPRLSVDSLAQKLFDQDVSIKSREDLLAALHAPGAPSQKRVQNLLQDILLDSSKEQRLQEVVYRADAYYRVLWASCTKDERLVLFQLAEDGWVNPKNGRAIQQLQRKQLVRRPAGFQVMNESFREFIRLNQYPEEIAEWEQEGKRSVWSGLRLSLIIAAMLVASWLFYAQQQDTGVVVGYLGAAGAAASAVYKLVSQMRGGASGGAPPGAVSA